MLTYAINIYNALGQNIYHRTDRHNGGGLQHHVRLDNLSDGVYMVQIVTSEGVFTKRMTLLR